MSSSEVQVVALALRRKSDRKYLLARRGPEESGAGFWEFPGGKIEENESQQLALQREIEEELGFHLKADQLQFIASVSHHYPTKKIRLHLWLYEAEDPGGFKLIDHDATTWVRPHEMRTYQISAADLPFIDLLL